MKTIRYIAALLLLISGIWHIILYIRAPADFGIAALAFGILYVITGLLLFTPKMIGVYLGLIPLVPLIMAPFMVDLKNLDSTTAIILFIDLVVFICCVYILLKRTKIKT